MTGDGKLRARWNEVLLEDAMTTCYTDLIVKAAEILDFSDEFFRLFPTAQEQHPLSLCVSNVYQKLRSM